MKGQAISFLTIIIIALSVLTILTMFRTPLLGTGNNMGDKFETRYSVLTMQNAMKAADIYMKTAGRYSVYQASYDVFRQGGFEDMENKIYNYWYDTFNPVKVPTSDDFINAISSKTEEYVNRYAYENYNFMREFSVTLPVYEVTLSTGNTMESVELVAKSPKNMVLSKIQATGGISSIQESGNFTDSMDTNLSGLYGEAAKLSITDIINEIRAGMQSVTPSGDCTDSYTSGNAEKESIKQGIMAIKLSKPADTQDYSYDISMVHSDTKRSPGSPCKYTHLGIVKVNITAKRVLLPVLNEDGPNFAPAELIFLIRYAQTSTQEAPTQVGLNIVPTDNAVLSKIVRPEFAVPDIGMRNSATMSKYCKNNVNFNDYIAKASQLFDISPALIRAVICRESFFNPRAGSSAGAVGLMQIIPATFKGLEDGSESKYCISKVGADTWKSMVESATSGAPREDPYQSIMRGACYISSFYNKEYSNLGDIGRIRCSLAAYNAGPGAVQKQGWESHECDPDKINYKETKEYVAIITSWLEISKTA